MIESGIRGGLSYISHRYAKANVPSMLDYNPNETTAFLAYWDCNSLYATYQTYSLPIGDFRFLTDEEIDSFDINSVPVDLSTGFILEVNLKYTESLHDLHNAYPLAPEHLTIDDEMISPTLRDILNETGIESVRQNAVRDTLSLFAVLSDSRFGTRAYSLIFAASFHNAIY